MSVAATDTPLSPSIQQFLATDHTMLINDNWVTALSGQTFSTVNPADGGDDVSNPKGRTRRYRPGRASSTSSL